MKGSVCLVIAAGILVVAGRLRAQPGSLDGGMRVADAIPSPTPTPSVTPTATCPPCQLLGSLSVSAPTVAPERPVVGDTVTITFPLSYNLPGGFDCERDTCRFEGGESFLAGEDPPVSDGDAVVVTRTVTQVGEATVQLHVTGYTEEECYSHLPGLPLEGDCDRFFQWAYIDASSPPHELQVFDTPPPTPTPTPTRTETPCPTGTIPLCPPGSYPVCSGGDGNPCWRRCTCSATPTETPTMTPTPTATATPPITIFDDCEDLGGCRSGCQINPRSRPVALPHILVLLVPLFLVSARRPRRYDHGSPQASGRSSAGGHTAAPQYPALSRDQRRRAPLPLPGIPATVPRGKCA